MALNLREVTPPPADPTPALDDLLDPRIDALVQQHRDPALGWVYRTIVKHLHANGPAILTNATIGEWCGMCGKTAARKTDRLAEAGLIDKIPQRFDRDNTPYRYTLPSAGKNVPGEGGVSVEDFSGVSVEKSSTDHDDDDEYISGGTGETSFTPPHEQARLLLDHGINDTHWLVKADQWTVKKVKNIIKRSHAADDPPAWTRTVLDNSRHTPPRRKRTPQQRKPINFEEYINHDLPDLPDDDSRPERPDPVPRRRTATAESDPTVQAVRIALQQRLDTVTGALLMCCTFAHDESHWTITARDARSAETVRGLERHIRAHIRDAIGSETVTLEVTS